MTDLFPVLDHRLLAAGDEAEYERLRTASRATGFFLLAQHGVPRSLIDELFAGAGELFALPAAAKEAARPPRGTFHAGYHGFAEDYLALGEDEQSPPDLREFFVVGREEPALGAGTAVRQSRFHRPNIWPEGSARLRAAALEYSTRLEALSAQVLGFVARSLGSPAHYFDHALGNHFNALNIAHYPPPRQAPKPGQLRASPHTDYGSLTLLLPNNSRGGLQVQSRAGDWVDVPLVPDAFVVNLGDLVEMWTNGHYRSALHRVCNPAQSDGEASRRISIVYFQHPDPAAPMRYLPGHAPEGCAVHPEFATAGDFMWSIMNKIAPRIAETA